jgi:hypothetical protein
MPYAVTPVPDAERWDRFVTDLDASPLVSARWAAAVSSPERRPIHLRLDGPEGVTGAIAGLVREPPVPFLRRFARSLFFYTGPALAGSATTDTAQAIEAIVDFARQSGIAGVVFRSWDSPTSCDLPDVLTYRTRRDEFVLDLSGNGPSIDERMRPPVHRKINQARKAGVTFEPVDAADVIDDLLRLMDETRAVRHGKGYEPYASFYMPHLDREALRRLHGSGLGRMHRVRAGPDTISAAFTVVLGLRAVALLVGTSAEGYRLGAPSLLWHDLACDLRAAGVRSLNLLGVPNDPSGAKLAFFKTSLGCERVACEHGATRLLRRTPLHLAAKLLSRSDAAGW